MKPFLLYFFTVLGFSSLAQNNIDTVTFETTSDRIVLDSIQANNIWQIGKPNKTVFTQAFAGTKAIVTDTLLSYPSGNTSSFYMAFELYGGQPYIEFTHRFDTDSLRDGGYVEMSLDSGISWILVSDTLNLNHHTWNQYPRLSVYGAFASSFYGEQDSLKSAIMGFSGSSNGWINSKITFPCLAIKKAFYLMLRFTFVSDSIGNTGDGWMIDNIIISNTGGCGSLEEANLFSAQVFPNPSKGTCTISLPPQVYLQKGSLSVYTLSGQEMLQQHFTGNTFELQTSTLPPGIYQVLISEKGYTLAQSKLVIQ